MVGEWRLYWVLSLPKGDASATADPRIRPTEADDKSRLLASPTDKMRSAVQYMDAGCPGLVLVDQDRIEAVCHLSRRDVAWDGTIWPLADGGLGVVDLVTDERARGRGHAVALLREAARRHADTSLLAHVWWNNRASLRAFRKGGARRIGFMAELFGRTVRLRWPALFRR